jgi:hypothetical protein
MVMAIRTGYAISGNIRVGLVIKKHIAGRDFIHQSDGLIQWFCGESGIGIAYNSHNE